MNVKRYFGFVIILVVVLSLGLFAYFRSGFIQPSNVNNGPIEDVTGYLGWEKKGFFEDSEVQEIFKNSYNLNVQINKKGSIEMVTEPSNNMDYLFPSNRIALELYRKQYPDAKSETVFFSPLVIYSWRSLLPDLIQAGLVTTENDVNYLDLDKLLILVEQSKTWQDINATELKGNITISSTDPAKSSSGNLFSALVLNSFTGKSTAVETTDLTPELKLRVTNLFNKMGLLDSSSGDIFAKFLTLGRTTYPFVVGYESQIIEEINLGQKNIDDVAVLYPKSTVWAEHEFISLDEKGDKLLDALVNETRFGDISWQRYGLRKTGNDIDNERYKQYGIPKELKSFLPLPKVEVIEEVLKLI